MSELVREPVSYILPIKSSAPNTSPELRDYIAWIAARAEVIVVDGSEPAIFATHEGEWGSGIRHVAPAAWRPVVDRVYPLAEIAAAGERLEAADRFGKVVLAVR